MQKVYTDQEAQVFFVNNSHGDVIAVNTAGDEKVCDCYQDAIGHINS